MITELASVAAGIFIIGAIGTWYYSKALQKKERTEWEAEELRLKEESFAQITVKTRDGRRFMGVLEDASLIADNMPIDFELVASLIPLSNPPNLFRICTLGDESGIITAKVLSGAIKLKISGLQSPFSIEFSDVMQISRSHHYPREF